MNGTDRCRALTLFISLTEFMRNFAIRNLPGCLVLFAITLATARLACFPVLARAQATQATAAAGAPTALYIDVVEGEGELNDIRARTAREPVVQVKDENHKPVAGALVIFSIRPAGAQTVAAFNGLPTLSVRTGTDGIARARGYQTARAGNVQMVVTATVGAVTAQVVIHQTNYRPGSHLSQTLSTHKAFIGFVSELAAFAVGSSVVVVESQTSPAVITAGPGLVNASRHALNKP